MALMGDLGRVFEIGPVFRAEKSYTNRHMTEFMGMDLEMTLKEHYFEALDVIGDMFFYIFKNLNSRFKVLLDTIGE
jgi:aspartyl/asparaginyl-tRNA synthetase